MKMMNLDWSVGSKKRSPIVSTNLELKNWKNWKLKSISHELKENFFFLFKDIIKNTCNNESMYDNKLIPR